MQFDYANSVGRPMTGTSSPDQMFFDPHAFKVSDEDEKKEDLLAPSTVDEPEPEPALVQKLTSQCNNLAWRLVAMEQELEQYKAAAAEEVRIDKNEEWRILTHRIPSCGAFRSAHNPNPQM